MRAHGARTCINGLQQLSTTFSSRRQLALTGADDGEQALVQQAALPVADDEE